MRVPLKARRQCYGPIHLNFVVGVKFAHHPLIMLLNRGIRDVLVFCGANIRLELAQLLSRR